MLRLFCLLAGLAATVTGSCMAPFKEVGEGCYYFSLEDDNLQLTWAEARQYCQSLGDEVDLAVLDYVCDDFRNLGNYLLLEDAFLDFEVTWIGASGGGDVWFWVDGRSLSISSSYWFLGTPDLDAACVYLSHSTNYIEDSVFKRPIINDDYCTSIHPFICQYNMA